MKKYEYQTKVIEATGIWGGKVNATVFNQSLNEMGSQGWLLIETIAPNEILGTTHNVICVFKREIETV